MSENVGDLSSVKWGQEKDAGEWKLLIEAGKGAKNEMQEYHHHIAVNINGNSFTLFYHFKRTL